MRVIIKNVTGGERNACCLDELQRVGVYEGDVVEGIYSQMNKSVHFRVDGNDCVAWVGETCEIVEGNERVN